MPGCSAGIVTHHRRYLVLSRLPGGRSRGLCPVLWGRRRPRILLLFWGSGLAWALPLGLGPMGRAWGLVAQLVRAHA